jgi:TRAP-type C4-dicarboxylate transport system permease large subunit
VALEEFERRSYSESLVLGTIAAGATLGILIPPSVNLIIYGALMLIIAIIALLRP